MKESNPNAPHVGHLRIVYEIMMKLPTGEVTGWPIKDRVAHFLVEGKTLEECQTNIDGLFDKIKKFVEENK